MTDKRRLYPAAVIVALMAVTVGHVAAYAGSFEIDGWAWLGWPYALAVDAAIVVAAYFTQWKTTRLAWWLYAAFVLASGFLNVGAVKPWERSGFDVASAWVYALFPTLAIAGLGFLERQADSLSSAAESRRKRQDSATETHERRTSDARATQSETESGASCEWCGRTFATPQGVSAHLRFCDAYKAHNAQEEN